MQKVEKQNALRFRLLLVSILLFSFSQSKAQIKDTLPAFSVVSKDGTITISWINKFAQNLSQVNVQRSKDSLKGFVTIHSLPNPDLRSFSYIDKTAKNDTSFYRVFILFEGANYIFTPSKKPFRDSTKPVKPAAVVAPKKDTLTKKGTNTPAKKEAENISQSVSATPVNQPAVTPKSEPDKPLPPPPPPKKVWMPSPFIYTGDDGNVLISLPDAAMCKYEIRFMREDSSFLFRIPSIKEPFVKLDKANFLQAGWIFFELYNGELLIEKNKFLITRDY